MTVARTRPVRFMHHDASERPFIVIWEVTRACQLVCSHCRADAIRTRDPRPPIDVNAGRGFAFIDHVGVVYPSGFLPTAVGSVHDQPFPEIYRGSGLLQALRNPDAFGGRCGRCEFRTVCGASSAKCLQAATWASVAPGRFHDGLGRDLGGLA